MSQAPFAEPPIADLTTTAMGGKPYTAPARQIWGWGIGRVAEFGLVAMFGQAINIFTIGFGLSPVIVSWCVMLPRLVDGIVDPVMGHWSDELQTPWGRRRPFMLVGALVGAVFLSLLWWASPNWNHTAQFLYLGIVGMGLYICYGAYAMAWNAIGYELSDDYHERSRIQAVGGFFTASMGLLFSWVYWLALRPQFGGLVSGMRWIGSGVALLIIGSAVYSTWVAQERFTHVNRTHVALLPAIRETISNRPFLILLLMKLSEIFGGRLTGGLAFFLSMYYICRGDQNMGTALGGIGATLGTVWSFGVLPFVKPLSKKIGKRGALILGAGVSFCSAILSVFITIPDRPWLGIIPTLVISPIIAISGLVAGAILPDICDVDELEHGQRREGLYTSVMAFVSKLEISLAVVLVGYVITWSGVDTKLALRWQEAADGKVAASDRFAVDERTSFSFKDGQPATFDTFKVRGDVTEVELLTGDDSPTRNFHSLGTFKAHNADPATPEQWSFPPVTAKYLKIRIAGEDPSKKAGIQEMSLSHGIGAPSLLASANGGKVAAAEPPQPIIKRFFWIVMIPSMFFTGLTFLITILFPLTEEKMKEVRRKLDEMRVVKAAAGLPTDEVAEEFVHEHPRQTARFVRAHPDIDNQDR
jgi:GPH family glycoside/pentoside/hexuronide:cation symporter